MGEGRRHLARFLWQLLVKLEPRRASCAQGEHRDVVVTSFGVMYWECVDCARREPLGPVFHCVSNKAKWWEA